MSVARCGDWKWPTEAVYSIGLKRALIILAVGTYSLLHNKLHTYADYQQRICNWRLCSSSSIVFHHREL